MKYGINFVFGRYFFQAMSQQCPVVKYCCVMQHNAMHASSTNLGNQSPFVLLQGEVTLVVEGACLDASAQPANDGAMHALLWDLIQSGIAPSQAAKIVAKHLNISRGQAYSAAIRGGQRLREHG
jgi:16S rRNA C1402 (ribose-2'-O) methylase RsmI